MEAEKHKLSVLQEQHTAAAGQYEAAVASIEHQLSAHTSHKQELEQQIQASQSQLSETAQTQSSQMLELAQQQVDEVLKYTDLHCQQPWRQ